jgi:hypothetical protein
MAGSGCRKQTLSRSSSEEVVVSRMFNAPSTFLMRIGHPILSLWLAQAARKTESPFLDPTHYPWNLKPLWKIGIPFRLFRFLRALPAMPPRILRLLIPRPFPARISIGSKVVVPTSLLFWLNPDFRTLAMESSRIRPTFRSSKKKGMSPDSNSLLILTQEGAAGRMKQSQVTILMDGREHSSAYNVGSGGLRFLP